MLVNPVDSRGLPLGDQAQLSLTALGEACLPMSTRQTSRRSGEDIAGKTLDFTGTEVIDDVVVVLTTHVATVSTRSAGESRNAKR